MRWMVLVLVVLAVGAGLAVNDFCVAVPAARAATEPSGFAVVELFTSEGCSSCPPADRLLGELAAEYADQGLITLSFHVDYWNDLGWRDPFSDKAYSERQRRYGRELSQGRVYTPQAVVNGRWETIGSRANQLRVLIAQALGPPGGEVPRVSLSLSRREDATQSVRTRVVGAPAGATLSLLLVQPHARSKIARGENANLTIEHHHVVRAIVTSVGDQTTLHLPTDLRRAKVGVAALLRDEKSSRILAASYVESE